MKDDYRLFRGGSWIHKPTYHAAPYRAHHDTRIRTLMHGFRVVEDIGDARYRVNRGGSWNGNSRNLRSAIRYRDVPDLRINDLGFRVVEDL